jgi:hypothetical protein
MTRADCQAVLRSKHDCMLLLFAIGKCSWSMRNIEGCQWHSKLINDRSCQRRNGGFPALAAGQLGDMRGIHSAGPAIRNGEPSCMLASSQNAPCLDAHAMGCHTCVDGPQTSNLQDALEPKISKVAVHC